MKTNINRILINSNNCHLENIVWIERGILLSIIYYLTKNYEKLFNKIIIIDIEYYRDFLKIIFPKLNFSNYIGDNPKNFYFNIRRIIKYQDIIFDYIKNYDKYIMAQKIYLVPWYDMNDILVMYKYNDSHKKKISKYMKILNLFSTCQRGNYINDIWDIYIENHIFKKYIEKFRDLTDINLMELFNLLNKFVMDGYTNTVKYIPLERPSYYYIDNKDDLTQINEEYKKNIEVVKINNEKNMNELIELLRNKLNLINEII
jgi:hypothetical protein